MGKNTLVERLKKELPNLTPSVSYTTRKPRGAEKNGVDYYFVTPDEFVAIAEDEGFLEWARVHGNFYGTSRDWIEEQQEKGRSVILVIDTQGALQVKKEMDAVLIFIAPPSMEELERRLRMRQTETDAVIATRLERAKGEMKVANRYDYRVINDTIERAYQELKKIVIEEENKRR